MNLVAVANRCRARLLEFLEFSRKVPIVKGCAHVRFDELHYGMRKP